jgi:hypothetical protein
MRRTYLGLAALLLCVPAAPALDDPPGGKDSIEAVKKQLEEAQAAQRKALAEYNAAMTKQQALVKELLAMAEKDPKAPAALAALEVVLEGNAGVLTDRQKALTILVRDHLDSPALAKLVPTLANQPNGEPTLRTVLEKSTNPEAQGQAGLALARLLKRNASRARGDAEKDRLTQEATKLLEEVAAKHADVKAGTTTLGAEAKRELAALKALANLTVGKEAPEIEGEDTDGKAFKLTDYRGKVVLLDFWGHW